MKPGISDKVMIYDDNCPLCAAYTGAFVKAGLLKPGNRICFSNADEQKFILDWNRARHEIPLIDLTTGSVQYGVDALVTILQQKFPFVLYAVKIKLLNYFFRKLYKLVSYNRKIIVAAYRHNKPVIDCTPDYSFFWRWILILLCYGRSAFFIKHSTQLISGWYHFHVSSLIVMSWLFIPSAISITTTKKQATDIHAHTSVITTIAGFLLLLTAYCIIFFQISFYLFCVMLLLIVYVIIRQIIRRVHFIKMNV